MKAYHPREERDKTKEKGESPKHLIFRIVRAFLHSFMRGRVKGITPLPLFPNSSPYNQDPCPSLSQSLDLSPHSSPDQHPDQHPDQTPLPSCMSSLFPYSISIPPSCPPLSAPPLSPYLQEYIRRPLPKPSTPSIHYPYAYSLNSLFILLFSYSLFIPPSSTSLDPAQYQESYYRDPYKIKPVKL